MKVVLLVLAAIGVGALLCLGGAWYYLKQRQVSTPVVEPVPEVAVTFPEGWRSEEMALRLVEKGILRRPSEYLQAADIASSEIRETYGLPAGASLAGLLFPDTYRFELATPASVVIEKQLAAFMARTAEIRLTYDTIILASIVEREARFDEDRAPIAGVYTNRLTAGMPLQADPTVQFAKAASLGADCLTSTGIDAPGCAGFDWWPTVLRADLQGIESPFNTYRVTGLPPEPICNPGLASLVAAATPADHDYVYFVTDKDGHAHFAKTLAEHNANVAKYR